MSRSIITIAAIILLSGIHAKAQFNTVSYPGFRYKVEETKSVVVINEKEATPESITSKNETSVPDNILSSSTDIKRKEQVARYLSVCYPLSSVKINSPYGYRKDPFTGKRKFHNGIDLHARSAKVFAMMQGRVIAVGQDKVSGKYITLQHGNFTVSYCHLSQVYVSKGQIVKAGDVVGISGNTGRSTGEHLHITCKDSSQNHFNPVVFLEIIKSTREKALKEWAS